MALTITEGEPLSWQVTQDDIDNGERDDGETCAIARSITREFPDYVPEVDGHSIMLLEKQPGWELTGETRAAWVAETPADVSEFIEDFDADEPVAPFEITLTFQRVVPHVPYSESDGW